MIVNIKASSRGDGKLYIEVTDGDSAPDHKEYVLSRVGEDVQIKSTYGTCKDAHKELLHAVWAYVFGALFAFFVVRPGYALPPCDTRHDGDVAEFQGDRYVCEAVLGQWVKQGGGK